MAVKLLLAIALLALGAFDVYVSMHEGYWSVFPPFDSLAKWQMFSDLTVALILFNIWMYFDWKRTGRPLYQLVPFLIAPIFLGSLAPLIYLLLRKGDRPS